MTARKPSHWSINITWPEHWLLIGWISHYAPLTPVSGAYIIITSHDTSIPFSASSQTQHWYRSSNQKPFYHHSKCFRVSFAQNHSAWSVSRGLADDKIEAEKKLNRNDWGKTSSTRRYRASIVLIRGLQCQWRLSGWPKHLPLIGRGRSHDSDTDTVLWLVIQWTHRKSD